MSEGIDNKISIYESILKQCIDAQQVLRDSLQEDQVSINKGSRYEGIIKNQFSYFVGKINVWVLKRTVSMRRFF